MDGISEVYSIAGQYDLAAVARVKHNDDLAELVTSKLINTSGIIATETLIAFGVFSKHDLESMFSIGMGD